MLTAAELTEAARAGAGLPSFYRLARVLGVNDSTVANWRKGRATPDDAMAVRLADMAGLDPAAVVAAMHAQRCTDDALRPILQRIAQRAAQVGALLVTAILSAVFVGGPDAQARATTEESAAAPVRPAVDGNAHRRAVLRALSHFRGVFRRACRPMVAPCCT